MEAEQQERRLKPPPPGLSPNAGGGEKGALTLSPLPQHWRWGRARPFDLLALLLFALLIGPPLLWIGGAVAKALVISLARGHLPWDARSLTLLGRSALIGISSAALALALGVPYALLTTRTDLPGRRVWAMLGLLPLALPPYAAAIAWSLFLGRTGPLMDMLKLVGAPGFTRPGTGPSPATGLGAVVWVLGTLFWPVAAFFVASALEAVPAALEDEARLWTSHARALRAAAGPYLRPALAAAALLVGLLAAADFGVPATFSLPVYAVDLQSEFAATHDYSRAWALAAPYFLAVLPLVLIQRRLLKGTPLAGAGGAPMRLHPLRLGRWQWAGHGYCAAVLALSVGVPLGVLVRNAGAPSLYPRVLSEAADPVLNSLGSGAITAAAGTILALCVAFALGAGPLRSPTLRGAVELVALLPYALPGSLIGIALIACLDRPGPTGRLYDSFWVLPLAYLVLFFPFAYKSAQAGLQTLDAEILEAAAIDGAGPAATLARVVAPPLRGFLGVAATLLFLLAARELDATSLLRPPGIDTLGFRIHDLFHYGPSRQVAALAVLATLGGAALPAAALWLASWRGQEE
jgi:iron(III) transport system permease protein